MNIASEVDKEIKKITPGAGSKKVHEIDDSVVKLYNTPLPSKRTGPLYNAFSYPTKISPEAIAIYIATHTSPGATVLDAFGGSGTTGLAVLLCDRPTSEMKNIAKSLDAKPKWGPRNALLFEIGTLGSFVSQTMCHPPQPSEFEAAVSELCQRAESKLSWLFEAKDATGQTGTLRHAIWSDILVCPDCATETSLWDACVETKPLAMKELFRCKGCDNEVVVKACKRATETVRDAFGREQLTKKRVLVRVHGRCGTSRWQRPPTDEDRALIMRINDEKLPSSAPDAEIQWGELHRAGYHLGIEKLHHFYTKRNFIAMTTLLDLASEFPVSVRDALRLLVLSYNASHSTLMTRVVLKKGQNDFVLTSAQSGVLYISGLPVEKNVIEGVRRKSKAFIDSFKLLSGSQSCVTVYNSSSESMSIEAESIDYIFTDPPFGDYIPYAELNQINELWLGRPTDRSREVIISPSQAKGVAEYGEMMGSVFKELARVLKSDGLATVVFHSAHSEVWRTLALAYTGAGFAVEATSVLDKIQASFKQIVATVSVKGDPLLLLSKRSGADVTLRSNSEIAAEIIRKAHSDGAPLEPQRLYSEFIGRCLELGIVVDMNARAFYNFVQTQGRKHEGPGYL
ncbi:putative methylase [Yersinia rohdei]|uniref:Putative methylase n=1 Tax=Yersinia rohdei TaxID=29485 RepID=A0A0U1HRF9_YERRO|nr:DNA methyltransferase [Yersinia rohdei]CQI89189.1 putative methylase [Yersinia rohdei]